MQAITLDVIMGGIFGIEGRPRPGTLEHSLRLAIRGLLVVIDSTRRPGWPSFMNLGRGGTDRRSHGLGWRPLITACTRSSPNVAVPTTSASGEDILSLLLER